MAIVKKAVVGKVGRNDPCPCGSGLKHKRCCLNKNKLLPLLPNDSFQVPYKETYEKPDPSLKTKNGIVYQRGFEIPQIQIVTVLTDLSMEKIDELHKLASQNNFIAQYELNICKHKLYAIRYHLENFTQAEQSQIQQFQKECKPHNAIQEQIMTAKLVYELEGFLFQVKSSLDVLATGPMNRLLNLKLKTYATNFVAAALEKPTKETPIDTVNKIKRVTEQNRRWIEEINKMRVQITHISDLKNFCCFIVMPVSGEELCTIYYPSMPDGTRASKFMELTWKKLFSMYKSLLTLLYSQETI